MDAIKGLWKRAWWGKAAIILGALFLCGVVGNLLPDTETSTPVADAPDTAEPEANEPEPTDEPEPTEGPTVFAVGDAVKVDPLVWGVGEVADRGQEWPSGNQFVPGKTTTGRFIHIVVGVLNDGDETATLLGGPKLVDDRGREFEPMTDLAMLLPPERLCILEQLPPGIRKDCEFGYEVPSDATGLVARVTDGAMFAPSSADIDLGLDGE